MQSTLSSSDPEIVSQVQLLKACLLRKSSLYSDINLMKIKKNYVQSNNDYRDYREIITVLKAVNKRLTDIRQMTRYIKKSLKPQSRPFNFDPSLLIEDSALDLPRHIFSFNFELETYIDSLKSHFENLSLDYDEKIEACKHQDSIIQYNDQMIDQVESLESEVAELQDKVQDLRSARELIKEKQAKRSEVRKLSFNNMKVYHKLSDNALKLQSRLSMKGELMKNIKITEREIEILDRRIDNNSKKVKLMEQEAKVQARVKKQHEPELVELNKRISVLNVKLEAMYREKDDLLEFLSADHGDEEYEEDETLQITDWSTRISEIKKEKELIAEENKRLEQTISKWTLSP